VNLLAFIMLTEAKDDVMAGGAPMPADNPADGEISFNKLDAFI
jgi:hypothetical protein